MSGRLTYRDVGRKGQRYPKWIRDLDGKSGAYVIRSKKDREVLYVGESHKRRLYGTLTRHFQHWERNVNQYDLYWGRATGTTYRRSLVEVACLPARGLAAIDLQNKLIARLHPRDNEVGGDGDEVPF